MVKIWTLEDDTGVSFVYRELLSNEHSVTNFASINELTTALKNGDAAPDLLIADVMLPDGTFSADCLVEKMVNVPTVIVSAMDDHDTLEKFFSQKITDYLTKPFNRNEFLVKIRRAIATYCKPATTDSFAVDVLFRTVKFKEKVVELTSREVQIVAVLERQRAGCTKKELMQAVWQGTNVSHKAFDVHISNLRSKLKSIGLEILRTSDGIYSILSDGMNHRDAM